MPKNIAYGVAIAKAPGGRGHFVLIAAPMDLTQATILSPVHIAEDRETRPVQLDSKPDEMGRVHKIPGRALTVVGKHAEYGETMPLLLTRLNSECGVMANAALLAEPLPDAVLAKMKRAAKVPRKPVRETARDIFVRGERALGILGLPDNRAREVMLKAGRLKADVEAYLKTRAERMKAAA